MRPKFYCLPREVRSNQRLQRERTMEPPTSIVPYIHPEMSYAHMEHYNNGEVRDSDDDKDGDIGEITKLERSDKRSDDNVTSRVKDSESEIVFHDLHNNDETETFKDLDVLADKSDDVTCIYEDTHRPTPKAIEATEIEKAHGSDQSEIDLCGVSDCDRVNNFLPYHHGDESESEQVDVVLDPSQISALTGSESDDYTDSFNVCEGAHEVIPPDMDTDQSDDINNDSSEIGNLGSMQTELSTHEDTEIGSDDINSDPSEIDNLGSMQTELSTHEDTDIGLDDISSDIGEIDNLGSMQTELSTHEDTDIGSDDINSDTSDIDNLGSMQTELSTNEDTDIRSDDINSDSSEIYNPGSMQTELFTDEEQSTELQNETSTNDVDSSHERDENNDEDRIRINESESVLYCTCVEQGSSEADYEKDDDTYHGSEAFRENSMYDSEESCVQETNCSDFLGDDVYTKVIESLQEHEKETGTFEKNIVFAFVWGRLVEICKGKLKEGEIKLSETIPANEEDIENHKTPVPDMEAIANDVTNDSDEISECQTTTFVQTLSEAQCDMSSNYRLVCQGISFKRQVDIILSTREKADADLASYEITDFKLQLTNGRCIVGIRYLDANEREVIIIWDWKSLLWDDLYQKLIPAHNCVVLQQGHMGSLTSSTIRTTRNELDLNRCPQMYNLPSSCVNRIRLTEHRDRITQFPVGKLCCTTRTIMMDDGQNIICSSPGNKISSPENELKYGVLVPVYQVRHCVLDNNFSVGRDVIEDSQRVADRHARQSVGGDLRLIKTSKSHGVLLWDYVRISVDDGLHMEVSRPLVATLLGQCVSKFLDDGLDMEEVILLGACLLWSYVKKVTDRGLHVKEVWLLAVSLFEYCVRKLLDGDFHEENVRPLGASLLGGFHVKEVRWFAVSLRIDRVRQYGDGGLHVENVCRRVASRLRDCNVYIEDTRQFVASRLRDCNVYIEDTRQFVASRLRDCNVYIEDTRQFVASRLRDCNVYIEDTRQFVASRLRDCNVYIEDTRQFVASRLRDCNVYIEDTRQFVASRLRDCNVYIEDTRQFVASRLRDCNVYIEDTRQFVASLLVDFAGKFFYGGRHINVAKQCVASLYMECFSPYLDSDIYEKEDTKNVARLHILDVQHIFIANDYSQDENKSCSNADICSSVAHRIFTKVIRKSDFHRCPVEIEADGVASVSLGDVLPVDEPRQCLVSNNRMNHSNPCFECRQHVDKVDYAVCGFDTDAKSLCFNARQYEVLSWYYPSIQVIGENKHDADGYHTADTHICFAESLKEANIPYLNGGTNATEAFQCLVTDGTDFDAGGPIVDDVKQLNRCSASVNNETQNSNDSRQEDEVRQRSSLVDECEVTNRRKNGTGCRKERDTPVTNTFKSQLSEIHVHLVEGAQQNVQVGDDNEFFCQGHDRNSDITISKTRTDDPDQGHDKMYAAKRRRKKTMRLYVDRAILQLGDWRQRPKLLCLDDTFKDCEHHQRYYCDRTARDREAMTLECQQTHIYVSTMITVQCGKDCTAFIIDPEYLLANENTPAILSEARYFAAIPGVKHNQVVVKVRLKPSEHFALKVHDRGCQCKTDARSDKRRNGDLGTVGNLRLGATFPIDTDRLPSTLDLAVNRTLPSGSVINSASCKTDAQTDVRRDGDLGTVGNFMLGATVPIDTDRLPSSLDQAVKRTPPPRSVVNSENSLGLSHDASSMPKPVGLSESVFSTPEKHKSVATPEHLPTEPHSLNSTVQIGDESDLECDITPVFDELVDGNRIHVPCNGREGLLMENLKDVDLVTGYGVENSQKANDHRHMQPRDETVNHQQQTSDSQDAMSEHDPNGHVSSTRSDLRSNFAVSRCSCLYRRICPFDRHGIQSSVVEILAASGFSHAVGTAGFRCIYDSIVESYTFVAEDVDGMFMEPSYVKAFLEQEMFRYLEGAEVYGCVCFEKGDIDVEMTVCRYV